ncbi:MAG: ferredoxin [Clostridium sp.]
MRAIVNKDECIGCGLCPATCPEVFEMADDGKAEAIVNEVPSGAEDSAKEAQEGCPTSAISID